MQTQLHEGSGSAVGKTEEEEGGGGGGRGGGRKEEGGDLERPAVDGGERRPPVGGGGRWRDCGGDGGDGGGEGGGEGEEMGVVEGTAAAGWRSSSIFIIIAGRSSRTMQVHFDFGDSQSGLCIKCCNQGGQVFVHKFFFKSC